ncbi:MAG: hypothetical protein IJ228_02210 [Succinivibrio sp.]|nr:hypothetical protein [Succinivibrio sp.]
MLITIAVMFIVVATFLLIIVNMFSDYSARREQDLRMIISHARNLIAETEELLLNQNQLPYSKTLVLVLHYRIIRALKKIVSGGGEVKGTSVKERIANEEKIIAETQTNYHDDMAFRPPESDSMAVNQLRTIKKLRLILKNEIRQGVPVNPSDIQKEDRRLYLLVLKVNISNLVQKVLEMKRLHQIGSCKSLIARGLEVIRKCNVKDDWLVEKSDLLMQLQSGLEAEAKSTRKPAATETQQKTDDQKEIDSLFGDKKKW